MASITRFAGSELHHQFPGVPLRSTLGFMRVARVAGFGVRKLAEKTKAHGKAKPFRTKKRQGRMHAVDWRYMRHDPGY